MIGKPLRIFLLVLLLFLCACSGGPQLPQLPKPAPKPTPTQPSTITMEVHSGGPAVVTTSAAEFQVRPDGYVQASLLLKDGRKLSLDEPRVGTPSDSDYAIVAGKEVHFALDFDQAQVLETFGRMGAGKRLEILAHPLGPSGTNLYRKLFFEAYDRYPNVLFTWVEYKNVGTTSLRIERILDQRHRFSAHQVVPKAAPWELWSYQGDSSGNRGEVVRLKRNFSRRNVMEAAGPSEARDIIVAFWTDEVGETIGLWDALRKAAAMPVKVDSDGRVDAQFEMATDALLVPEETYSGPRNFLSVYGGDGAKPQHLWDALPQRERTEPAQPPSPTRP